MRCLPLLLLLTPLVLRADPVWPENSNVFPWVLR